MSRQIQTSVYLPADLSRDIKRLAGKTGLTQSRIIRKGVELGILWAEEVAEQLEGAIAMADRKTTEDDATEDDTDE